MFANELIQTHDLISWLRVPSLKPLGHMLPCQGYLRSKVTKSENTSKYFFINLEKCITGLIKLIRYSPSERYYKCLSNHFLVTKYSGWMVTLICWTSINFVAYGTKLSLSLKQHYEKQAHKCALYVYFSQQIFYRSHKSIEHWDWENMKAIGVVVMTESAITFLLLGSR